MASPPLVAQTRAADVIALPVTLRPSGDTLPALATCLETMRIALQAAGTDPYRVSIEARVIPMDATQSTYPTTLTPRAPAGTAVNAVGAPALLPADMRFAVVIVRPMHQLDPHADLRPGTRRLPPEPG